MGCCNWFELTNESSTDRICPLVSYAIGSNKFTHCYGRQTADDALDLVMFT